jgi:hypothetical protein
MRSQASIVIRPTGSAVYIVLEMPRKLAVSYDPRITAIEASLYACLVAPTHQVQRYHLKNLHRTELSKGTLWYSSWIKYNSSI